MNLTELQLKWVGPRMSVAGIKEVEGELGCPFPTEYKQFLKKFNGGHSRPAYFIAYPGQEYPAYVTSFTQIDAYGAIPDVASNVNSISRQRHIYEVTYGLVPKDWLVIGMDDTDNLIVIRLTGKQADSIGFVFAGEEFSIQEKPNKVYLLAKSFNEFIASLSPTSGVDGR
jgi:hypothetical protein